MAQIQKNYLMQFLDSGLSYGVTFLHAISEIELWTQNPDSNALTTSTTLVNKKAGFFLNNATNFHPNKENYMPPVKLLKRRFICDQSQFSSSFRLEVIK